MKKEFNRPWTRFHDDPRKSLLKRVPEVDYPANLADLIALCRDRPSGVQLRAAGSHWALSEAAISDHSFIETHDPKGRVPAMEKTLVDVVPGCLHPHLRQAMSSVDWPLRNGSLIHVECGKRIYQLYAELDQQDAGENKHTLAGSIGPHFSGRWGLETMGNSGGQTVVGAFSTGTHGGDIELGALADQVVAIHLVADGGQHYWIELVDHDRYFPQLTDDDGLQKLYGKDEFGGPDNFKIIRDNRIFDSVLVSAGRFGVIYSVVLRAVPQYSLWERRRMHLWQDIRTQIADTSPGNPGLFQDQLQQSPDSKQRFLGIVVCLTTHMNFMRNLAGVTKRWKIPGDLGSEGRSQRIGERDGGPDNCPNFTMAGKSHPYTAKPDHPELAGDPGMLEKACANASFIGGLLSLVKDEIEEFVESNGVVVGAGVAAVAAAGGIGLLALLGGLALALLALKELLDALGADDRMGETMEKVKNKLLDPDEPDPIIRAANLFAWQMLAYKLFQALQGDYDAAALSFALLETHDYQDVSCNRNVASVEVFFDANDSRLIAFIDALIAFEIQQELQGKACLGYAALRFTGPSRATIGPQQWWRTCSVEVAALKDVTGSEEMVEYAARLALNPNMGGILHWGQYNPSNQQQVEMRFGPRLTTWRSVLAEFNGGGGFSNAFSRRTGLEP
jgi:hypothetical protein